MSKDPVEELVDEKENVREMSYLGLSDDIHLNIFGQADIASRLKLGGVNKRLNGLQLSVKNELEEIHIRIRSTNVGMRVKTNDGNPPRTSRRCVNLEYGLRRLALNTSVRDILVDVFDEEHVDLLDSLFNFKADTLKICDKSDASEKPTLTKLNLSTLLTFAENIRDIMIELECTSVSPKDLCTLRKMMLEGKFKLESFHVKVNEEVQKSFMEECYGVTYDKGQSRVHGTLIFTTRTYRAQDESVELFSSGGFLYRTKSLNHFEGGIHTAIHPLHGDASSLGVSFKKSERPNEEDYVKLEWNQPCFAARMAFRF